jgi:DNA polymerase-3 subunit alpha
MECQKMGIHVLPPQINKSGVNYSAENKALRFPIKGIKGIGPIAAEKVVNIQLEKKVDSLIDFVSRKGDININVIESMIYAGVFDEFSMNKRTMIEILSKMVNFVEFDYNKTNFSFVEYEEFDYQYLHDKEKELLGINFKYHILHMYEDKIQKGNYLQVSDILENNIKKNTFVGVVSRIKRITTKKHEEMAFVEIEDLYNGIDSILFPREFEKYNAILTLGDVYIFSGVKEMRNNKTQFIIENIKQFRSEMK